jgi:hypothetical protein
MFLGKVTLSSPHRFIPLHFRVAGSLSTTGGVSSNRVKDLEQRSERDSLEPMPSGVSIYIAFNDTWRRYDKTDPTTVQIP